MRPKPVCSGPSPSVPMGERDLVPARDLGAGRGTGSPPERQDNSDRSLVTLFSQVEPGRVNV